jgi:hypothetical protein
MRLAAIQNGTRLLTRSAKKALSTLKLSDRVKSFWRQRATATA